MSDPSLLQAWLTAHGLEAYAPRLIAEGVEDLETLGEVSEQELADLGLKLGHRKRLLKVLHGARGRGAGGIPIEISSQVIESFPYPIALPMRKLWEGGDLEARTNLLVDLISNLFKYQAMILQSEYLCSDVMDEELSAIIRRDLRRPSVPHWVTFVQVAVARLSEAGVEAFVPELGPAFARAETKRGRGERVEVPGSGFYDERGEFIASKEKVGLVLALMIFDNKVAQGWFPSGEKGRKELKFYLEVVGQLLQELSWMADYVLLKREEGITWRMMGFKPQPTEEGWSDEAGETGLALLAPCGERVLPLFPLSIV